MERLNKSTSKKEIDGVVVYRIILQKRKYQSCAICEEYFELTGNNIKYCPACRKQENSRKTNERHLSKKVDKINLY